MRWWICESAGSDGESANLHPVTHLASDLGGTRQKYHRRYKSTFVRYISRRPTTICKKKSRFLQKKILEKFSFPAIPRTKIISFLPAGIFARRRSCWVFLPAWFWRDHCSTVDNRQTVIVFPSIYGVGTSLMWFLKRKFFFSTYVEIYHTSTILWWPIFQRLFHHSNHVFRWPWRSAASAHTIACGPMTPQPSAQVSPPHHGRWCLRLALYHMIRGTSC